MLLLSLLLLAAAPVGALVEMLMVANRAISVMLNSTARNTSTHRVRSRRVLRCHQGGLLRGSRQGIAGGGGGSGDGDR